VSCFFYLWAYSSVWLERTPDKREVSGSIPLRPTVEKIVFILLFLFRLLMKGAIAQLGERLVCNQEVIGSIPISSTRYLFFDNI
jgi:hypothetical protein